MTELVWLKRDLRIQDHEPLYRAAQTGRCLCLYVYEPEIIEQDDFDAAHLDFINQSLLELRDQLQSIGGRLILKVGQLPQVLDQLKQQIRIGRIWAHQETTNAVGYERDRRVRMWAQENRVPFVEIPQNGVVRRLASRDGWARSWHQRMNSVSLPAPNRIEAPPIQSEGTIQQANHFRIRSFHRTELQLGGEKTAWDHLKSFLRFRGQHYSHEMSSPVTAVDACSRLSPYLAYGNISLRSVYQTCRDHRNKIANDASLVQEYRTAWKKSLTSFEGRLRWHCHFIQKMEDEPEIEFHNMNRAYDGLREDEFDKNRFDAWCHGQTGFPMVDACMRALRQTGWINFRMRAMLISFAAYQLWLHWRKPALYLARLFLDYEPGIHYSQCQMQSGVTGINMIRIYSPIKQAMDQDPSGVFIRHYLPELQAVPDHLLVEPHKMTQMEQSLFGCRIGRDYPPPVIDHRKQYQVARDRIFAVRETPHAKNWPRRYSKNTAADATTENEIEMET